MSVIAALLFGGDGLIAQSPVRVRVQTELGDIVVEVDQAKAPVTAANFLRYVDARGSPRRSASSRSHE